MSRSFCSLTVQATAGDVFRVKAEMQQSIQRRIRNNPNIPASSAITA
jgi:hypothetical protein